MEKEMQNDCGVVIEFRSHRTSASITYIQSFQERGRERGRERIRERGRGRSRERSRGRSRERTIGTARLVPHDWQLQGNSWHC